MNYHSVLLLSSLLLMCLHNEGYVDFCLIKMDSNFSFSRVACFICAMVMSLSKKTLKFLLTIRILPFPFILKMLYIQYSLNIIIGIFPFICNLEFF